MMACRFCTVLDDVQGARFKVAESPDVFCAELSSLMALFGLGAMSDLSPLSGVKRKLDFGAVRAAFDPQRTFVHLADGVYGPTPGSILLRTASTNAGGRGID